MLFKKIKAVYSQNHMTPMHKFFGQDAESVIVKADRNYFSVSPSQRLFSDPFPCNICLALSGTTVSRVAHIDTCKYVADLTHQKWRPTLLIISRTFQF